MSEVKRWTAQEIARSMAKSTRSTSRHTGGSWICRCPAHQDVGESLSCRDNTDKEGNPVVLFNCFAGCDFVSIVRSLRSHGIDIPPSKPRKADWKAAPPPAKAAQREEIKETHIYAPQRAAERAFTADQLGKIGERITKVYDWFDDDGRLIFHTVRVVEENGNKKVMPVTPCTRIANGRFEWRMKGPDGPRPLYNSLQDHDQKIVLVVEGEKSCDAAREVFPLKDVWVTSTHGGSKSAYLSDWKRVKNRKVVIGHDLDQSGLTYASVVCQNAVLAGAKSIHLWTLPTSHVVKNHRLIARTEKEKKGYDIADSVADGWTLPRFAALQQPWHGPEIVSLP